MVWLLCRGKKALARRAATSFSMTLSRGLTNAAFVEYLEAVCVTEVAFAKRGATHKT